jgi:hypothetical protein
MTFKKIYYYYKNFHSENSNACHTKLPRRDGSDLFILIGYKCGQNDVNINLYFFLNLLFEVHLYSYSLVIRQSLVL